MAEKDTNDRLSPRTQALVSREEARETLEFTKAFFDTGSSKILDETPAAGVKITGGTAKQKDTPIMIDLREATTPENPAISQVSSDYGVYNPEEITVDTLDLMKRDPTVRAGLAFIKLPIIALPWRIECDNEKIKRFTEDAVKRIWRKLVKSMLTAVEYGFASHEKVFKYAEMNITEKSQAGGQETYFKGRGLIYKKIKPHHPSSVQVVLDDLGNFDGIIQEATRGEVKLKKSKCFFFTHDEEFGNPFGITRLKPAYKYWYWKEVLYQFMMMYYERRGSPPILATAPPGESRDRDGTRRQNLESALDLASSLLSNSIAVLPFEQAKNGNENMWDIRYMSDDKRGEMFIQAINHLDAAILRSLWIPERVLTQEGGKGSYSMASVHADLFLMSELGLVNDIEAAMDEQIIPTLVAANFKPKEIVPCYFKMDSMDWNRKIALKEIFLEMLRNVDTMVQVGMTPKVIPSLEEMAKILEVPTNVFEEEVEVSEVPDGEEQDGIEINPRKKPGEKPEESPDGKGRTTKTPPKRYRKTSSKGSREVDRKDLRPGGKRAEQMRGKLADDDDPTTRQARAEIYEPTGENASDVTEIIRYDIINACGTERGLREVKKGIFRIKVWSGLDFIPDFDNMESEDMVKHIRDLPPHHVDILHEAMSRTLTEEGLEGVITRLITRKK